MKSARQQIEERVYMDTAPLRAARNGETVEALIPM